MRREHLSRTWVSLCSRDAVPHIARCRTWAAAGNAVAPPSSALLEDRPRGNPGITSPTLVELPGPSDRCLTMRDRQPEYTSHQPASIGIYVADRADDAADLREDLRRRAEQSGQALSVTINPSLWPAADMDPYATIMVVVGYTDMIADSVWAAVERCRSRQIPVLVTYDPRLRYEDQSPKQLRGVNGHRWPVGSSPDRVTRTLTRMVGIDVSHRRIFLSYRRGQGGTNRAPTAPCSHRCRLEGVPGLVQHRAGRPVPTGALRDLDARSLVLVIESRGTRESAWVDDEIAFATAHGIGIRALVLPGGGEAIRFPAAARIARSSRGPCRGRRHRPVAPGRSPGIDPHVTADRQYSRLPAAH